MQILLNAINGTVAGISNAYINLIISGYNKDLIVNWNGENKGLALQKAINIIPTFWYNPELNYKVFMVPAILVILIAIMGMILSGLNIVSEKRDRNYRADERYTYKKISVHHRKAGPFLDNCYV